MDFGVTPPEQGAHTHVELILRRLTCPMLQVAPRAKIFRRDVGAVNDLDSLKKIMRYNGWPDDSYSGGNPNGAICSRGDLSPTHPSAAGCYDTKVSSYGMAMRMESDAINGPTTQGQKPFSWKDPAFVNTTHEGMPRIE